MTDLPEPPVPPEVVLRDFYFMPLDVARLRDCRFVYASSGEGFRSAVLLWCASWHQIPAASLPDDDVELAHLAGFGRIVSEWLKVKSEAMHGFILCSDGRWYHPHIAKEAMNAWKEKLSHRARTEAATKARQEKRFKEEVDVQRDAQRDVQRDVNVDVHQGTGTGTGTGNIYDANASLSADIDASADSAVQTAENKPGEPENTGTNGKTPPCPHQKIIDLYHKHLASFCPKVRIWEGQRPKKLLTLWKQNPDLEWWDGFFAYCAESKFLTGRSPPRQGAPPFVATMEWLINPTNFQKIYEGIYHRG